MSPRCAVSTLIAGLTLFGLGSTLSAPLRAQIATTPGVGASGSWPQGDWLQSSEEKQRQAATGESFQTVTTPAVTDPTTVITSGSLWQETTGAIYTKRLADTLSLSCQTSQVDYGPDVLSRGEKATLTFKPSDGLTFTGDLHGANNNSLLPGDQTTSDGGSFTAEGKLPTNSTVTFGLRTDRTQTYAPSGLATETNSYDAQIKQPIGSLPLSAMLKGHFEDTAQNRTPISRLPSIEQSLEWKPSADTTVQAGLRQQQYEEYPGIDRQLNEALFADWKQKLVDNISWHSYAEVLNTKGLVDQAPASPIASGANGTPQATTPGSNASPTSSLPISLQDQTLTLSTGPQIQVQKDISAAVEFSDRFDRNPAAGAESAEQRVSLSVKGTF